jgi:hypothetical protein
MPEMTPPFFTLILADDGKIQPSLQNDMVEDPRPGLKSRAVEALAEKLSANAVVEVAALSTEGVEWSWVIQPPWSVAAHTTLDLCQKCNYPENVTLLQLQRSTPCSNGLRELYLVLIRTMKGKPTGPTHLTCDADRCKGLAYAIFEELLGAEYPVMFVGNLGMGLARLLAHAQEYEDEHGVNVTKHVQIVADPTQHLFCLTTGVANTCPRYVPELAGHRAFVVQMVSSDGSHHAEENTGSSASAEQEVTASHRKRKRGREHRTPREERSRRLLKVLAATDLSRDTGKSDLAYALLVPVVRYKSLRAGDPFIGPIDPAVTLQRMNHAIDIAEEVRRYVGTDLRGSMTIDQRTEAYSYLKQEIFQRRFMANIELKLWSWRQLVRPGTLRPEDWKAFRTRRRNAWKSWVHDLLGNTSLFHALVREGLEWCEIQQFLSAWSELALEEEKAQRRSPGTDSSLVEPPQNLEALRKDKERTRRLCARAKRLCPPIMGGTQQSVPFLTATEAQLQIRMESGELQRTNNAQTAKLHEALGIKNIDATDAVLRRMSTNQMEYGIPPQWRGPLGCTD